ncbi:hypothetical protein [Natrarchaeobaculum sulfurireducens]|uniref:hypothetical protein n=1 Tax=Natrarchaeobaculum sulfurireducens TaxID=2044521 RepID=UPI00105AB102|nr:hypothetical protein [Natrarchaeobaculum sulfurireducens]
MRRRSYLLSTMGLLSGCVGNGNNSGACSPSDALTITNGADYAYNIKLTIVENESSEIVFDEVRTIDSNSQQDYSQYVNDSRSYCIKVATKSSKIEFKRDEGDVCVLINSTEDITVRYGIE